MTISEDDYPTGPLDLTDTSDPYVRALINSRTVVDDLGNLHDKKGRFTFKTKRLEYEELQQQRRRYTWAEVSAWDVGPENWQNLPHVTIWDWPADPSPEKVSHTTIGGRETLSDGSVRYTYGDGTISIILPGDPHDADRVLYEGDPGFAERVAMPAAESPRKPVGKVPASTIRSWAMANGYSVSDKGRIPASIQAAYHAAQ